MVNRIISQSKKIKEYNSWDLNFRLFLFFLKKKTRQSIREKSTFCTTVHDVLRK
ncbi:predicted protein [Enterococcus faecium Com15]|nr:predicted protein [Enterococcus faecium Com15]